MTPCVPSMAGPISKEPSDVPSIIYMGSPKRQPVSSFRPPEVASLKSRLVSFTVFLLKYAAASGGSETITGKFRVCSTCFALKIEGNNRG